MILGEAKVRGVPVVAGAHPGGVEYVVGKAGGPLVDIEKPDVIADATLRTLTDTAAYPALQQAAHDDAAARFATAQVARYVEVYEHGLRTARR